MLNLSHSLAHRPPVALAWYLVPLTTVIATIAMVLAVGAGTGPSQPTDDIVSSATVVGAAP